MLFSRVRLFVIPGTIAHQAPLSKEFSRQEYWRGLPFPSPGDLPGCIHNIQQKTNSKIRVKVWLKSKQTDSTRYWGVGMQPLGTQSRVPCDNAGFTCHCWVNRRFISGAELSLLCKFLSKPSCTLGNAIKSSSLLLWKTPVCSSNMHFCVSCPLWKLKMWH